MMQVFIKEDAFVARIAAAVLGSQRCAIVFRRTICLHGISREDLLRDKRLLCHELTHVMQWKKLGVVKFLALYLWYSARYGYYMNPLETEARANEQNTGLLQDVRIS